MKVKTVMTKDPISVELPSSRDEVLKLLVKHNKTGIPVLHKGKEEVAGVVTRQHIFAKPEETQLSLLMDKNQPYIGPDALTSEAAQKMLDLRINHIPVVEGKKMVGIITPTDLLKVIEKKGSSAPVDNFVRQTCVTLFEDSPLNVAIATMKLSRIYALPVLNKEARLSGIVTDRDIFTQTTVDGSVAIADLGLGDDEDDWTWEGLRNVMKLYYEVSRVTLPDKTVSDIMIKDPVSIFKKTNISEAAKIMLRNDFGQIPIRNSEDRLEAMIYELDLVSALL